MTKNEEPFWFRLISTYLSKGWISNGLTIPYIIGAYSLVDNSYQVNDKSISLLLKDIVDSSTQKLAVLQNCGNLQQYVIGLADKSILSESNKKNCYYNPNGDSTLLVVQYSSSLGKSIEQIIDTLNEKYLQTIKESKFSYRQFDGWEEFTDFEKDRIKKCN